jgi:hypothetical protein
MYEQPSLHWELAKQRHSMFADEAKRAQLVARAQRRSWTSTVLSALRDILPRPSEDVQHNPQLQPSV